MMPRAARPPRMTAAEAVPYTFNFPLWDYSDDEADSDSDDEMVLRRVVHRSQRRGQRGRRSRRGVATPPPPSARALADGRMRLRAWDPLHDLYRAYARSCARAAAAEEAQRGAAF